MEFAGSDSSVSTVFLMSVVQLGSKCLLASYLMGTDHFFRGDKRSELKADYISVAETLRERACPLYLCDTGGSHTTMNVKVLCKI
jgi:hypothetical protein